MKMIENLTAENLVSVLNLFGSEAGEKEECFINETKGTRFTVSYNSCIYDSDGNDYFYDLPISIGEWEQLEAAAASAPESAPKSESASESAYPTKIKKVFVVENQDNGGWSEGTRSVVGIEVEGKTLKIRKLKGIDVTLEGFLHIIQRTHTELSEISKGFERISPYKTNLHEGFSGCRTWEMSFLQERDGFWIERRNDILHVTCFGKIPDQDIFIPDLALIITDLAAQAGDTKEIRVAEVKPIDLEADGYICPQCIEGVTA